MKYFKIYMKTHKQNSTETKHKKHKTVKVHLHMETVKH